MAFSQRHYRSVSPPADTPRDIAWRFAHNAVLEQVRAERAERPTLTSENWDSERAWVDARIKELMRSRGFVLQGE